MHQPRPYGLAVQGGELTEKDQALISAIVLRFTNYKQTGQLDSLRNQYDLPDGGYFVVQDMGNIFKVLAYKSSKNAEPLPNGLAQAYVPMLFSGVFGDCFFRDHEKWLSIKLTEHCRKRLSNYTDQVIIPKDIDLERFAIEYPEKFQYLQPQMTGPYFRHSQYMRIKPTLYSGAMTEVMQIVSGYGRLYDKKYKDHPKEALENAQLRIPEKWLNEIETEIKGHSLPGYSGFPQQEGFIQYDYKPGENDLVSFDSEGYPWLVRIQSSGVFAMPLPIIPATSTQAFREFMESVGDDEIIKILDRFKAMPSGETFPAGRDFETWKRAGVIIKICESSDFYQYQSLYGACGWSINSSGKEAFNTCFHYRDDGLMQVHGYKVALKLGPMIDKGWIAPQSSRSALVSSYLSSLFKLLDASETRSKAITYKIRRVPMDELMTRAAQEGGEADQDEVDYWDNYQSQAIASHGGNLSRTTSGSVYWPFLMYPQSMGRFKFPTLTGEGCESLVMISPDYKGDFVACDTVIFGAYVDDQLRYIKYFYDERKVTESNESTFEEGMIVGSWEETKNTSQSGLLGHFYTTDADDRRLASPSSVYTKIVGTDMGYGNPAYQTPGLLFTHGSLSRSRYYKHVTKTDTVSGDGMDCAVCVPNFNRDCILYVFQESTQSKSHNEKHALYSMNDPTSYELWTYDPIFHYMGGIGKGRPSPSTGDYVYVYGPKYNPTEYSDFADSGDWYGVGGGYIDVSAICAPYTDRMSGTHHAMGVVIGGEGPSIEPFDKTTYESNVIKGRVDIVYGNVGAKVIHRKLPDLWYFQFSPVESGGSLSYFQRDACRVSFGESLYANISDENATKERRQKWGSCSLVDSASHHYFIGVINE